MAGEQKIRALIRRRSGAAAGLVAIGAFALGSFAAFRVADRPPAQPIILRQAIESNQMSSYDETPGAGGVLVLMRNDSATPVEVIDAAFSRTTAIPPLYIAPETVAPGAEVNVYVPLPGACSVSGLDLTATTAPPVQVQVIAHRPGTPQQLVPVEITGQVAVIMRACLGQKP